MQHFRQLTQLIDKGSFDDALVRRLAYAMAFMAGAINAGGFLAVHRYTSHVTGAVSSLADHLALGEMRLAASMLTMVLAFIAGAANATFWLHWSRRRRLRAAWGAPIAGEALLLLLFGLMGAHLARHPGFLTPPTVLLLCFIMGMHNTLVTKLSAGLLRSTHMTGIATDIGIELAKLCYVNRRQHHRIQPVRANRQKLAVYLLILALFFAGGVAGALGFGYAGYGFTVPLALLLLSLGLRPMWYDLRLRHRMLRRQGPGRARKSREKPGDSL